MNESMKSDIKWIMRYRLGVFIGNGCVRDSLIKDILQASCARFHMDDTPVNQTELLELAEEVIQAYKKDLDKALSLLEEQLTSGSCDLTSYKPVKIVCPTCNKQSVLMTRDRITKIHTGIVINDGDIWGDDFVAIEQRSNEDGELWRSIRRLFCSTCEAELPLDYLPG